MRCGSLQTPRATVRTIGLLLLQLLMAVVERCKLLLQATCVTIQAAKPRVKLLKLAPRTDAAGKAAAAAGQKA